EPAAPEPPPSVPETASPQTETTTTPADTPVPEESEAAPQADAAATAGPFTVQVASFDSNNLERAKRFKVETEEATDFTVNLVPSADGKHVRAFVGEYKDRAAADAARDTMRKVAGFEDCFVKALGEE
ncbi:MAG: SPOR domain-containing protein, partial [Candidatus Hydrogenedentes bacterium]|nr:SPOR domain-containing protein [Candidatus Hydrogenedentota bacterium]